MAVKGSVTIVFRDLVTGVEGREPEHVVEGLSHHTPVPELVEKALSLLKDVDNPRILLYAGSVCLESDKTLANYNKSRRSKLTLLIVKEEWLRIKVKTLQQCGAGACLLVPLWATCCRQTILVEMPSHGSVGTLKQKVEQELNDSKILPYEKIGLAKGRTRLTDDTALLKDVGIKDNSTLTVFVPCCYFKKPKPPPEEAMAEKKTEVVPEEDKKSEAVEEEKSEVPGGEKASESSEGMNTEVLAGDAVEEKKKATEAVEEKKSGVVEKGTSRPVAGKEPEVGDTSGEEERGKSQAEGEEAEKGEKEGRRPSADDSKTSDNEKQAGNADNSNSTEGKRENSES